MTWRFQRSAHVPVVKSRSAERTWKEDVASAFVAYLRMSGLVSLHVEGLGSVIVVPLHQETPCIRGRVMNLVRDQVLVLERLVLASGVVTLLTPHLNLKLSNP